jgi:molecular chaperone DnaK
VTDPIVGIDLGTSTTVVACCDADGQPQVLADDNGYKIQPSVVSFHPGGSVIVGAEAKQRRAIDPRNTIYSVKRLIGRSYHAPEIGQAQRRTPFAIKEGVNQQPVIVTRAGEFAIPEISAIVLDRVRTIATRALGCEVARAVITVPASFVEGQRSATATAGAIAGLTVVRVLNEPTAAALAYGHRRQLDHTIAVYDFGGGTFDVTILRVEGAVFEVLGTAGDSFLGGDDLDERLVEHMVQVCLARQRVDLRDSELAMMRLRAVAEQVKIELSRRSKAVVKVDEIAYGPGGAPLHLELELTRDELVQRIGDLVDRTFPVCGEALRLAQLGIDDVHEVVLVGGSTKIPYVRAQVDRYFGRPARTDVNPEEAVAIGAALQAEALGRVLTGKRVTARTSVAPPGPPLPARPPTVPPPVAAPRPTAPRVATPARITRPGVPPPAPPPAPTLFGVAPGPRADSEETTAARPPAGSPGAPAPRADGRLAAPTIVDVTPRGLGIGTVAGYCEELIRRNARLPAEVKRNFTTSRDRQSTVRIRVCQGESRRIDENLVVGELILEGLEPRPRGDTTIEVTFALDADGILQVRARDARTGHERRASLDVLGAQSPDEVAAARARLRDLRT